MKNRRKKPRTPTTTISTRPRSSARPRRPSKKKKSSEAGGLGVAYLSLGSNLGDRAANLRRALASISAAAARVERVSSLYRTEPVGYARQPLFYNLVARVRWRGSARSLLERTSRIERAIGRKPTFRNGPRVIDIDLLDVGGAVRAGSDPILPHPRLRRRRFVLAPLAEIAPEWRDPVSGRSAAELLAKLPARPRVWRLRRRLRRASRRTRGAARASGG